MFHRASAMECIMAIAQVLKDKDFADVELRNQVAEVFLFFLPGIASGLTRIAVEDEKVGHKVPMVCSTKYEFLILSFVCCRWR